MQSIQAARLVSVDHVLIVSRDPAATAEQLFVRTGLASIPGGEHDGLGTRNVIVPLGEGYLEIVPVHLGLMTRDLMRACSRGVLLRRMQRRWPKN